MQKQININLRKNAKINNYLLTKLHNCILSSLFPRRFPGPVLHPLRVCLAKPAIFTLLIEQNWAPKPSGH